MSKTYAEKLKDPRWQKKRLEIMQRDEFSCQICYDNESMLTVHHRVYKQHAEPWEYEDKYLVTLCESCHKSEHDNKRVAERMFIDALYLLGFFADDLICLAKDAYDGSLSHLPGVVSSAIGMALYDAETQRELVEKYFKRAAEERKKNETQNGVQTH